jgi:hypothetical protein
MKEGEGRKEKEGDEGRREETNLHGKQRRRMQQRKEN